MQNDPHRPQRRSIRLQSYDYSQPGSYFVTICTHRKKWLFGNVVESEVRLNSTGKIAHSNWVALPERFSNIEIDQYVVMPNHLHGIITILDSILPHSAGAINRAPTLAPSPSIAGAINRAPTSAHSPAGAINRAPTLVHCPASPTLGEIIRAFKAVTSRQVRCASNADFAWQRGYHEHIIRKNGDLDDIRQYIVDNPARWNEDSLYHEE